jgi:hypothetical protein
MRSHRQADVQAARRPNRSRLFETKGWLQGVAILVGDVRYEPDFYDPVRYAQTLADDVEVDGFAVPENVVVVAAVTPTG